MKPTIEIEYCPKCGWLLRAAWMAQELLTTFTDDLHAVQLRPSEVAGRYTIKIWGRPALGQEARRPFSRTEGNQTAGEGYYRSRS